jgi:hypothetical protein
VQKTGDVLVAGCTYSRGSGESDIILLKYAPSGAPVWEQLWGGPAGDEARAVAIDGDAAFVAGETRNGTAGENDGLVFRVNAFNGQVAPA